MMKLGFLSAILPDASLEQVLATAARLGYDCVELACWPIGKSERRYSGVTHIDATKNDDQSIKAIHELTEKYSVSISGWVTIRMLCLPIATKPKLPFRICGS